MRYYIIAGEASGDLHGSNLIKHLRSLDSKAKIRAWGGDLMQKAGAEIVKHYKELAFMGFIEVVANLRTILNNITFCKKDIIEFKPDVVILIDYPGFNLRIAEFTHKSGIKNFYYISPQIWAWKKSRIHKIKRIIDRMFVILPFEKDFYQQYNYQVDFVGHPLLDAVTNHDHNESIAGLDEKKIIALLPGSRQQEVKAILPIMLSVKEMFKEYTFVVAAAPSLPLSFYKEIIGNDPVRIVENQTYALLKLADAALVTSGTATLEAALFKVPEVVCYKGSKISYEIAKRLVDIEYISLVNLIMEKEVVKELIQEELTTKNLQKELRLVLKEGEKYDSINEDYKDLEKRLGGAGASQRTAELMMTYLK